MGSEMCIRDRDKPHFEGAMGDTTSTCEMISESQNFKIHKASRLCVYMSVSVLESKSFTVIQGHVRWGGMAEWDQNCGMHDSRSL